MLRTIQYWLDRGPMLLKMPYLYEREAQKQREPAGRMPISSGTPPSSTPMPRVQCCSPKPICGARRRPYFGDGDEMRMNFHFPLITADLHSVGKAKPLSHPRSIGAHAGSARGVPVGDLPPLPR